MAQAIGGNQHVLQAILGHTQISTTARYVHATAPQIVPVFKGISLDRIFAKSQRGGLPGCTVVEIEKTGEA